MDKILNNIMKPIDKSRITIDFRDKINLKIQGIEEVDTVEEMNEKLEVDNIDKVYKYIGETNELYKKDVLYKVREKVEVLGGEWVGTPVPNNALVEKIYINTELTEEEMMAYKDKFTPSQVGETGQVGYFVYVSEDSSKMLILIYVTSGIALYYVDFENLDNTIVIYVSNADVVSEVGMNEVDFVGWNPNFVGYVEPNAIGKTEMQMEAEVMAEVGHDNAILSGLFSTTIPFGKTETEEIRSYYFERLENDLIEVKELPKVQVTGTVIPTSGYCAEVYINTNISDEELIKTLNSITFAEDNPVYIVCGGIIGAETDSPTMVGISVMQNGEGNYIIMGISAFGETVICAAGDMVGQETGNKVIWNYPKNRFSIFAELQSNVEGMEVGTQNEKLTNLFSFKSFEIVGDARPEAVYKTEVQKADLYFSEGAIANFGDMIALDGGKLELYVVDDVPTISQMKQSSEMEIYGYYAKSTNKGYFSMGGQIMTTDDMFPEAPIYYVEKTEDISIENMGLYVLPYDDTQYYRCPNGWEELLAPKSAQIINENGYYNVQSAKGIVVLVEPTGGTLDISSNGNYDVINYQSVNVNVTYTNTLNITNNGTHNVQEYGYANVNVPYTEIITENLKAVPKSGFVRRIYVNTSLSYETMVEMFDKLTFVDNLYYVYVPVSSISAKIVILKLESRYDIQIHTMEGRLISFSGSWSDNLNGDEPIIFNDYAESSTYYPIGENNDILKELFSVTPFVGTTQVTMQRSTPYNGDSIDVTKNGEINIKDMIYSDDLPLKINVNVEQGTPIEISTESQMDVLLLPENVGFVYKYVGETTSKYKNGSLYMVEKEVEE